MINSIPKHNSTWLMSAIMIASILWLGVFGIIAMSHGAGAHVPCPVDFIAAEGASQPMGSNFCADVHMGMVRELSNAIPERLSAGVGSVIAAVFLLGLFVRTRDAIGGAHDFFRVRYRECFDKDPHAFFSQIKQWISLRKAKDFAYCLA